jgi:hypothetical protein
MRRASVFTLICSAALCALIVPGLRQATVAGPATLQSHPTIEPTLPLALNLILTAVDGGPRGGTAVLEVAAEAGADLQDLSLSLKLADALRRDGLFLPQGASIAMRRGESRRFTVPLSSSRAGEFPIRLEASYRLGDGRTIEAAQGVTLRIGVAPPEGRENAGAYEFMAVPLDDLRK